MAGSAVSSAVEKRSLTREDEKTKGCRRKHQGIRKKKRYEKVEQ